MCKNLKMVFLTTSFVLKLYEHFKLCLFLIIVYNLFEKLPWLDSGHL